LSGFQFSSDSEIKESGVIKRPEEINDIKIMKFKSELPNNNTLSTVLYGEIISSL